MDSNRTLLKSQIENKKNTLLNDTGSISLTEIIASHSFQETIHTCREFRERVFTPLVTLLLFIKQVISPDKSCNKVVSNFVAEQSKKGIDAIPSTNTGPYSKARQRLPEAVIGDLLNIVGESIRQKTGPTWKVYGREIKAFDGTTISMADTEANQASYPQHGEQKKGAGFPIARLLVVMSLSVGTVIDYALGAYQGKGTGEQTLLREVKNSIQPDDIVLGDRNFPSYFLLADLAILGADGIFKGHAQRKYDFRQGEKRGKKDHVTYWKKPQKPDWMDKKTYQNYPSTLRIREFKVDGAVYVTTFFNAKQYPKRELAKIYKLRWHIEINLKSIKSTMMMDKLSCKTPEMVRKEIGIHFLAYNIIRILIAEAGQRSGVHPREISCKGAIQLLHSFMPFFMSSTSKENERLYARMLSLMVKNKIGNRPGRFEPRRIKQRGRLFKFLNQPRHIEKIKLKKKIERKIALYAEA